MYEYAKYEFNKWLSKLNIDQLTPPQQTIINILINHFDEIARVGTANGERAKLIGRYISELNQKFQFCSHVTSVDEIQPVTIKRINKLKVEKFRGFDTEVEFPLDKRFTFFHGPNGSGKTSFCEALEYSLLGFIEEASTRNMPVDKYIVHAGCKKATTPVLECLYNDSSINQCEPDFSAYRFAFLEKNRIDAFSHVGATTAKNQTDRIAALFGLSEFQDYVSGFTDNFDERYIKLKAVKNEEYEKQYAGIKEKKETVQKELARINPIIDELNSIIKSLNVELVTDVESAKFYLMDPNNGIIPKLLAEKSTNTIPVIEEEDIKKLTIEIQKFKTSYNLIKKNVSIILKNVANANLYELFKALIKVKENWTELRCPACQTPLERVDVNPFEYATTELTKLDEINRAKRTIQTEASNLVSCSQIIKEYLKKPEIGNLFQSIEIPTFINTEFSKDDFVTLSEKSNKGAEIILNIHSVLFDNDELCKKIEQHNKRANEENKKYAETIRRLQTKYNEITEKNSDIEGTNSRIVTLNKEIGESEQGLQVLETKAKEESSEVDFNSKMTEAYYFVKKSLKDYALELPLEMAKDLSVKVQEYYNYINQDDAEFEMIENLALPTSSNERILVKMRGEKFYDAMLILSEGHVRILGLSILLAKAVKSKVPFLIFDDVVNAIDDDHRDGIANLLTSHPDFADIQMVITCHGELFVANLESRVNNQKLYNRYFFLPADSLNSRGITIKYQDSTVPLKVARRYFESGELKDCAAKCRQAVECITSELWKKIAPFAKDGISVNLRKLNSTPDLYSRAIALSKALKNKFEKTDVIMTDLNILIHSYAWILLNKGTHFDDSIPEFTQSEIKNLLELIERISDEVNGLKLRPINIGTSGK